MQTKRKDNLHKFRINEFFSKLISETNNALIEK